MGVDVDVDVGEVWAWAAAEEDMGSWVRSGRHRGLGLNTKIGYLQGHLLALEMLRLLETLLIYRLIS